eukprot:366243-Chlamydomonas_euryale.AAC.7
MDELQVDAVWRSRTHLAGFMGVDLTRLLYGRGLIEYAMDVQPILEWNDNMPANGPHEAHLGRRHSHAPRPAPSNSASRADEHSPNRTVAAQPLP